MINFDKYLKLLAEQMPRLAKNQQEVQKRYDVASSLTSSIKKAVYYSINWSNTKKVYGRKDKRRTKKVECQAKLTPLCLGTFVTKDHTVCIRCRHLVKDDV